MERSVSLLLSLTHEHSNSHKYSHSYPIFPEIHKHPRRDLTAVTDQLQKVWAYCLHNPLNLPCSSQSDLILVSGLTAVSDINWKLYMNQQITWQYYINKQSYTQQALIGQRASQQLSCVDVDSGLCDVTTAIVSGNLRCAEKVLPVNVSVRTYWNKKGPFLL